MHAQCTESDKIPCIFTDLAANTSESAKGGHLNTRSRSHHDRSTSQPDQEGEHDILSLSYTSISSRGSTESGIGDWLPIEQRVEELEMKYKYTIEVITEYFEKNVTPQMLGEELLSMPPELKRLKVYNTIKSSDSENPFLELLDISDYRHSEVLQQLVSYLGDESCKRAMALYQDDLLCFNTETTLREFVKNWLCVVDNSEQGDVMLKMGAKWENRTLQDFEEFKRRLQQKAHFDVHDLQTSQVESACVRVTLTLASESIEISNLKFVEPEFYRANNVLQVLIGNNIIYSVESPKVYTCTQILIPE